MKRSAIKPKPLATLLAERPKKIRARKCAICKTPYSPRSMMHRVCGNVDCAASYAAKLRVKAQQESAKHDRKETKEKLDKLKTRSDHMKAAQIAFNRYIRSRAIRFNHPCISSGRPLSDGAIGGGFDCGHYRSVGSAPHLRFNMNNAWGQSKQDNRYGAGASFEYRRGLIARRGIKVVEALESDNTIRKFDVAYLVRIRKIFTEKAKRISKYLPCD